MNNFSQSETEQARQLFEQAYHEHMAGEIEDAINLYQQSIELVPTAEAHTFLGWAYSMQKRYEDAIDECLRAIELDDQFGNPYNDIGTYMIEMDRWDEAADWLKRALEATHYEHRALPHLNLARVHTHSGDLIAALQEYKAAWQEDKSQLPALHAYQALLARLN